MKIEVLSQKNKKVSEVEVKNFTEDGKINSKVLAQYVFIYQSNQRSSGAKTKDRADVSGGGKKPFAQKGTGNARAGSNRSPLWKGGGITFGPTGNENWKKKMTKNFRRSAFQNAMAKSFKDETIKLIDEVKFDEKTLTKQAVDMVNAFENPKRLTVVTLEKNENAINAFANLKNARIVMVNRLNSYDLLKGGVILIEQKAMDYLTEKYGDTK